MAFEVKGLPESIRVAGHDIAVTVKSEQWRTSTDHHGEFCHIDMEILIAPTFAKPGRAAEIVIHEVMHAIWWAFNVSDRDDEERTITNLAGGLQQVWRDNPALIEWINEAMRDQPSVKSMADVARKHLEAVD